MARVVLVHGINNTNSGPDQMAARWLPPLLDGVRLAGGAGRLNAAEVGCACYGDVFRPPGRFLGPDDAPMLHAEDVADGLELDLLMQWWRAAAAVDPAVVPPDARTLGLRSRARAAVLALSGSRFLVRVSERMLVFWINQVTAYFTQEGVREKVQQRLAEQIDSDSRVIIAHSLGSVVAYEALCANPHWPVTDLITLGSPLGAPHTVFDRLLPPPAEVPVDVSSVVRGRWPHSVKRWTNIVDTADFVAVQPRLRHLFGDQVCDIGIDNGASAHTVDGYLSARETGAAVLAGLTATPAM